MIYALRKNLKRLVGAGFLVMASVSEARVFSFSEASVGVYLKGNVGTSQTGTKAFSDSSGAETNFFVTTPYNFGGEFGLLFTSQRAGLRLGVEVVNPRTLNGAMGLNAAGTPLMSVDSTVTAIVPAAHLEGYLVTRPTSKLILSLGAGYAYVSILNSYKLTTVGQTAYPGVVDFVEEGAARAIMGEGAIGYEVNLFDTVTTWIDAGYRYLQPQSFTHTRDAVSFLGAVSKGAPVKTAAGSDRALDLSGVWVGVGFRFYLNL